MANDLTYLIVDTTDIDGLSPENLVALFELIQNTDINSLRRSIDQTLCIVKATPELIDSLTSFLDGLTIGYTSYTYAEILVVIATAAWTIDE